MNIRNAMMVAALALAPAAAAQPPQPPLATVEVGEVVRLLVAPTMPVTGTVHSRQERQLTAGVDGRLTFVAEPGVRVARGDAVVRIETETFELRRNELQAQADRARAQLRFLDAQLARQQGLADSRVLSANDLEQTLSQRDVAASDLRIAEVRLLQIEDEIRRATIVADFDGVVTERLRRAGEDIARGTVVARLIDAGNLEVRVLTPLQHHGRIQVGDRLRVLGYGRDAEGVVRGIVPATDPRRQAFELLVDLPAADSAGRAWSVGELVSVALPVLAPAGSLAVPQDALILRQDGTYVVRINADGVAERIAVEVGDSHGGYVATVASLEAGDRVVVRGGEALATGQRVTVIAGDA